MGEKIVIPLKKPLQAASENGIVEIKQIVLREPNFDEYLTHGDPYTVASSKEGLPFVVDQPDVIATYIRLCLVEPKDPAILSQGGARLGKQVKEAVLSFFRPDAPAAAVSATSPTN